MDIFNLGCMILKIDLFLTKNTFNSYLALTVYTYLTNKQIFDIMQLNFKYILYNSTDTLNQPCTLNKISKTVYAHYILDWTFY